MFSTYKLALVFAGLGLAQTGPAPSITNNKAGTTYTAELTGGSGGLRGSFSIVADDSGKGVNYGFSISGFNLTNSTEFSYHIHQNPVPSDGNCTATGMHFDQYGVTDSHKCDPTQPQTCQLGDLSGKHGIISFTDKPANSSNGTMNVDNVHDDYLSTSQNDTAFIGGRSIVVDRKSDSARLACGNIILVNDCNNTTATASCTAATTSPANATSTAISTTSASTGATTNTASPTTNGPDVSTGLATAGTNLYHAMVLSMIMSIMAALL